MTGKPGGAESVSSTNRIHVLTAVTRPENLADIGSSLQAAIVRSGADVVWHLRFDPEQQHIGGQQVKNELLDEISDGWIFVLDDDTLVHPELFTYLDPATNALVFSMQYGQNGILFADERNAKVGSIDIGQVILRRELIGYERIKPLYDGDGHLLQRLLHRRNAKVRYVPEVLTYYNAIRGGHDVYGLRETALA